MNIFCLLMVVLLCACQKNNDAPLNAQKVAFKELPQFEADQVSAGGIALQRSCRILMKSPQKSYVLPQNVPLEGTNVEWQPFCENVQKINFTITPPQKASALLRSALQTHLHAYKLQVKDNASQAKITGYYEPLLRGSLRKHGKYKVPLYQYPTGAKLKKVAQRLKQPRSQIIAGGLKGLGLEVVYVNSAIEAFFLQIQGSGRVLLDDGRIMRLGFAGHNFHDYHPIGKTLVEKNYLVPQKVTMQNIKAWLKAHPHEAEDIMSTNKSYVFFKVLSLKKYHPHKEDPTDGPIGSQGVPLTARRSIAIDPRFIPMGAPLWITLRNPSFSQLVVAQDTGGAIKGGLRADYFCGFGNNAGETAGTLNAEGHMYLFLPKTFKQITHCR